MTNITVEIDGKYREHLDVLKQIIPAEDGSQITDDSKMVEALVESFMWFLQQQAAHEHGEGGWCCGGGWCGSH